MVSTLALSSLLSFLSSMPTFPSSSLFNHHCVIITLSWWLNNFTIVIITLSWWIDDFIIIILTRHDDWMTSPLSSLIYYDDWMTSSLSSLLYHDDSMTSSLSSFLRSTWRWCQPYTPCTPTTPPHQQHQQQHYHDDSMTSSLSSFLRSIWRWGRPSSSLRETLLPALWVNTNKHQLYWKDEKIKQQHQYQTIYQPWTDHKNNTTNNNRPGLRGSHWKDSLVLALDLASYACLVHF